jgi:hypothetical protein
MRSLCAGREKFAGHKGLRIRAVYPSVAGVGLAFTRFARFGIVPRNHSPPPLSYYNDEHKQRTSVAEDVSRRSVWDGSFDGGSVRP